MVRKLVYGVGINDLDYPTSKTNLVDVNGKKYRWECPFYKTWIEMLRRGFSEKEKARHPRYANVTVCEEWKTASKFKAWMEQQDWEGLDLDKDILVKGCQIYSPETCCFVPSYMNTLLVTGIAIRGKWPLGVSLLKGQVNQSKNKIFRASIKNKRNKDQIQKNLGHFVSVQEAHTTWQKAKYNIFMERLEEYSKESCFNVNVYNAIKLRAINLKLDMILGKETLSI